MLANRLYTSNVVARTVRASTMARSYAMSVTSAPKTTPPATPTSKFGNLSGGSPQGLDELSFAKARLNLPVRLYSKSGVLASRLYVIAEKSNKGDVDKVAQSLKALGNELKAHPKLNQFISSPAKSPEQKRALLKQLSGLLKFHPILTEFVDHLATKRSAKELVKLTRDFESIISARDKVVTVKVTLASKDQPKPKAETIQKIFNYDKDTKISLDVVYDPSIEGGAILSSRDKYVDLSFKKELTALKAVLAKKQAEAQQVKRTQFLQALSQYENVIAP